MSEVTLEALLTADGNQISISNNGKFDVTPENLAMFIAGSFNGPVDEFSSEVLASQEESELNKEEEPSTEDRIFSVLEKINLTMNAMNETLSQIETKHNAKRGR